MLRRRDESKKLRLERILEVVRSDLRRELLGTLSFVFSVWISKCEWTGYSSFVFALGCRDRIDRVIVAVWIRLCLDFFGPIGLLLGVAGQRLVLFVVVVGSLGILSELALYLPLAG